MVVPIAWLLVAAHVWGLYYMFMLITELMPFEKDESIVDMVLDMLEAGMKLLLNVSY